MMHAKSDSEVTSLTASSPTRSPRRPVYYVQSPSRDSHDGEKTTTSLHSTPVLSPMGSPPHSHSSVSRHSRESSTSRFSGSLKPGSRKVNPNDHARSGKLGDKPWKEFAVIEEEGLLEEENREKGIPRRCYVLAFFLGFAVLFSMFALILWGASRPQKPRVSMKSITFENFNLQAGTDASGVPTELLSTNFTVRLTFRNRASFFGVHVTSSPVDISYYQLNIASGSMKKFYQPRKSERTVNIHVIGDKIPLYGGSASLTTPSGTPKTDITVPLKLRFTVRSRAYVLGKLVKPKFYIRVECPLVFDRKKLGKRTSLKNCRFERL